MFYTFWKHKCNEDFRRRLKADRMTNTCADSVCKKANTCEDSVFVVWAQARFSLSTRLSKGSKQKVRSGYFVYTTTVNVCMLIK